MAKSSLSVEPLQLLDVTVIYLELRYVTHSSLNRLCCRAFLDLVLVFNSVEILAIFKRLNVNFRTKQNNDEIANLQNFEETVNLRKAVHKLYASLRSLVKFNVFAVA